MSSRFDFLPPLSPATVAVFVGALVGGWLVLRAISGRATNPARRWGLTAIRLLILAVLAAMLAGPVRVDESSGELRRPEVFCLVDASRSMDVGGERTRWDEAWDALDVLRNDSREGRTPAEIQTFLFGHRLSAVSADARPKRSGTDVAEGDASSGAKTLKPSESDTRLAEALRQLSGRFGRRPPAGVVLFSDGRARNAGAVERLAEHFADRGVPVHAFPVGDTARGGDVAIVSVVAPRRIRKFSDVEVQVFFRSFGYSGVRTEASLVAPGEDGAPDETLAVLPITLRGGAQSATLTYRADDRGRKLEVRIPGQQDELTQRNNVAAAEVAIDRTKIRVLYLEGSEQPLRAVAKADGYDIVGAHSTFQTALSLDEDVECVSLIAYGGANELVRAASLTGSTGRRGFPETLAELAAFDCVVLSDVPSRMLTEEQIDWLARWVENRGGGLLMVGGPKSFAEGGWNDTPLVDLLPVRFNDAHFSQTPAPVLIDEESRRHAVWQITADREQNLKFLDAVPAFTAVQRGLEPKPAARVLARFERGSSAMTPPAPLLVAGEYGRGRTMALAAPISENWSQQFLEDWSPGGNRYSAKFFRNIVYWLTESSSIGRRRLVATVDKRFYRLGESVEVAAVAWDETARRATGYSVWAMVEPQSFDFDDESLYAPLRWPNGVPRESEEESPWIGWGEEFELRRDPETESYRIPLELADQLKGGLSDQGLRLELTAYENSGAGGGFARGTQVDSTSLDLQILDDPFEQQNPFPNHDLLSRIASVSGGRVLRSPADLTDWVEALPTEVGPPVVRRVPLWNRWWLLAVLVGLLTIEWLWRRAVGLA